MNNDLWMVVSGLAVVVITAVLVSRIASALRRSSDRLAVGVGTVRTVVDEQPESVDGERQIWIEVSSVHGDTFIGRLMHDNADADLSALRPGLVVLVAFDPAAPEHLSLPDDELAVRASGMVLA